MWTIILFKKFTIFVEQECRISTYIYLLAVPSLCTINLSYGNVVFIEASQLSILGLHALTVLTPRCKVFNHSPACFWNAGLNIVTSYINRLHRRNLFHWHSKLFSNKIFHIICISVTCIF